MKTVITLILILLTGLVCGNLFPVASAITTSAEDFRVTYGSPADPTTALIPANSTTEDFLNSTNPYANYLQEGVMTESGEEEGSNPLYVLVFGDEEERASTRVLLGTPYYGIYDWKGWATLQIERGDEALVANFGIDVRILGFEEWNSDDSKSSMYNLWDELAAETSSYLGTWYEGEHWSNYVDAIIGITYQSTPADPQPILGLSPGPEYVDQGKIFILLKWPNTYWGDDNLIQHEISHLFYADDYPYGTCGVMASPTPTHYWIFLWEDDLWAVFASVPCALTSYTWCTTCSNVINAYKNIYNPSSPHRLILRHGDPDNPKCSFLVKFRDLSEPIEPGILTLFDPVTLTFEVTSIASGYNFEYWLVDGQQKIYTYAVTITISGKRTIAAYFKTPHYYVPPGGGIGGGHATPPGLGANPK